MLRAKILRISLQNAHDVVGFAAGADASVDAARHGGEVYADGVHPAALCWTG